MSIAAYMVVEKILSRTNDIINTTEIRIPTCYAGKMVKFPFISFVRKLEFVEIYMALPLRKFMQVIFISLPYTFI